MLVLFRKKENNVKEYIVTDLTRFQNDEKVCTAILDSETGECLRPLPYFSFAQCKKINMHPGAVLQGTFFINSDAAEPHVEDARYENDVEFIRIASSEEFKEALVVSLEDSVSEGFGAGLIEEHKYIPFDSPSSVSIITVKVAPQLLSIHKDRYKEGKIKLSFRDNDGERYSYLSITDRGFYDYAMEYYHSDKMNKLEEFIANQDEVYLRVGLSRRYKAPDGRDGFWLQANGIYTFPDFLPEIRQYK